MGVTRPVVIACSLGAVGAAQRRREWCALLDRALVSRTPVAGGVRLELEPLPGVRQEVERLVLAERACCPFMTIDVRSTDAVLVLSATAPATGAAIVAELFSGRDG